MRSEKAEKIAEIKPNATAKDQTAKVKFLAKWLERTIDHIRAYQKEGALSPKLAENLVRVASGLHCLKGMGCWCGKRHTKNLDEVEI